MSEECVTLKLSPEQTKSFEESLANQKLLRDGQITKKEYERRERELIAGVRAQRNLRQGLPPDYESPEEKKWKRILAERRVRASAKRKRKQQR